MLTFFPDVPCSASYSFWLALPEMRVRNCTLRSCGSRTSCGRAPVMLLVERLLLVCFWVLSYVGPGPNDVTRLKSDWMSVASGIVCVPRTLLGRPELSRQGEFYNSDSPFQLFVIGATKDPLSVDEAVDLPCVELLNENRTLIRKYPETFLCFVGLSRSLLTLMSTLLCLHENDEGMSIHFKVKVRERTLAENDKEKEGGVCFWVRLLIVRKRRGLMGIVILTPEPYCRHDVTSSFVTPTREHALEDVLHDNLRTRPPTGRFVFLSSSSTNTDIPAASKVVSLVSSSPAGVRVPTGLKYEVDGHPVSALEFEIGTLSATPSHGSFADDFYESQTVDSATAMNVMHVSFLDVVNITRPPLACLYDFRIAFRYEIEIMSWGKFWKMFMISGCGCLAEGHTVVAVDLKVYSLDEVRVEGARRRVFIMVWEAWDCSWKSGWSLTLVEAYDPKVEGKYVVAVSKFEGRHCFQWLQDAALSFPIKFHLLLIKSLCLFTASFRFHKSRDCLLSDAIPAIRQYA
ncbi:hypothetical protein Tco_0799284 [Tanacetum coccineum]